MDDSGVELGDTELYLDTIRNSAHKGAQHFIDDIADLCFRTTATRNSATT
jgi:hypothetical protein